MNDKSGFTLLELMLVTAIIAVLALVAVGYFRESTQTAQENVGRYNLGIVRDALSRYFQSRMEYPANLASLTGPYIRDNPYMLLVVPFNGQATVVAEIPQSGCDLNAFNATQTRWIEYNFNTPGQGQIKNIKLVINNATMTW